MVLLVFMRNRKRVEKTYEQRQEEARRRVEIRRAEFSTRFSQAEERKSRAEERERRKEARGRNRATVGSSTSAPLTPTSGPEIIRGLPPTVRNIRDVPQAWPPLSPLDVTDSLATDQATTVTGTESQSRVLHSRSSSHGSRVSEIMSLDTHLNLPVRRDPSLGSTSNPDGGNNDYVLDSVRASPSPVVGDGGTASTDEAKALLPGKFEARELIIGKSEDSVLNHHLGMTDAQLAKALEDPMAALEKEWFPLGFRILADRGGFGSRSGSVGGIGPLSRGLNRSGSVLGVGPLLGESFPLSRESSVGDRDYGDAEYHLGMSEAEKNFGEGLLDDEEFRDEKERLADEFEDRRYKWWIAGANFDYICYGKVGDIRLDDNENFWVPPQVLHSFRTGEYHGGKISRDDYDTGHFDTPVILVTLDMAFGETGEVNDKGEENEARMDFKKRITLDLSRASSIPIEAEDLPVITVSPDPARPNAVIVAIHVLENSQTQRGPDMCWQIARDLCEQSSDTSSALFQGHVTSHLVHDGARLERERERTGMTLNPKP